MSKNPPSTNALNSRLGRRIVGLFVSCALIPLTVLAVLALTQVSTELQDEADRHLRRTTKATGTSLAERLLILSTDLELAIEEVGRSGRRAFESASPLRDRLAPRFLTLVDGPRAPSAHRRERT